MRVSSFVLPMLSNNGESLADIHSALRAQLCATFGGFTATASQGGWIDSKTNKCYMENGLRYDVACESCDHVKLDSIALFYGRMANQISVMVCHDGAVFFHDIAEQESMMQKIYDMT
jgi:hypothetical protein